MTNEEKIKSMSTEEFVDWLMILIERELVECWKCPAQKYCGSDDNISNKSCKDVIMRWMKEEVEE